MGKICSKESVENIDGDFDKIGSSNRSLRSSQLQFSLQETDDGNFEIVNNKSDNFREPNFIFIIKRKIKKGIIIKIPPIVGVFFFFKWLVGPSVLIFWSKFNFWIILRPFLVENKEIKKNNV